MAKSIVKQIAAKRSFEFLTRQEVAQIAEVSLATVDKAIETRLLLPKRGQHGAALLDGESVIVISLLSGTEVPLPHAAKMKVKKWVYEEKPHRAAGRPELSLSRRLVIRCDADVKQVGKKLDRYLTGRSRYIESNPDIFGGEPVIAGTRLMVRAVADRVADGDSIADLSEDYPYVPKQAFETALLYAKSHPRRGRPRKPWRES
jgi:uncharacterized protein (DUF433 family)